MIDYHTEAVTDFNTLIKKNPKNAHAYFRRAFSLKALKVSQGHLYSSLFVQKFTEAVEDFEMAKSLDPHNPQMLVNYKQLKDVSCIVLCKPGEEKFFNFI